jgi:amino acid adenylation domain-containing protein
MNGQLKQIEGLSLEEKRKLLADLLQQQPPRAKRSPLSFAQERLWFLTQLEPENPSYNLPFALRLSGDLDIAALEKSIDAIIARHETLRTKFVAVDGEPFQFVSTKATATLEILDLSSFPEAEAELELKHLMTTVAERPFDLARDYPVRVSLLKLAAGDHVLLVTMHHIISDAWSVSIFAQELSSFYKAFTTEGVAELPELPIQYSDFVKWQRTWLQGDALKEQLAYWVSHLAGAAKLNLPTDHARPKLRTHCGGHLSFTLPADLTDKVKKLSHTEGATLFMTLLAAFNVLLFRYTGELDIVVGSPIAGRNRIETEPLIGFFVNSLALRTDLSGNPTFRQLIRRVKEVAVSAYAHQDLPFEKLVEELNPARDVSQTPVFQVMFGLQNAPRAAADLHNLNVRRIPTQVRTAKFDLTLLLSDTASGISGWFEYNADLFESSTIERLKNHFENLLVSATAAPDASITALPLLGAQEQQQILLDWNNTATAYPREKCIQELFEEQVRRSPNDVALVFNDRKISYETLNKRANQLAQRLKKHGVGPEVIVGLAVDRSVEMIVGLLAILKAGGAYLPLDASYPRERLAFMIEQTRARIILTQKHLLERLPASQASVIALDVGSNDLKFEDEQNPVSGSAPENLAYVIYTSGSTGDPKGVSVTHRNVVRLVKETNYARLTTDEVFLQFAPITFDAATFEIWGALLNGARLVVTAPGIESLGNLGDTIQRNKVTTLWLTAGLFHQMVDGGIEKLQGVRQLLAGGDVLSVPHVETAARKLAGCQVINGYGPTENTTFTCCERVTANSIGHSVPIGRPIANTKVFVLSSDMQLVPVGIAGELFIGGDGLARGYLDAADATAEKFLPNPFARKPGERLYRTGDQVRYRSDGSIEFLGRLDQQVKIRGYRIELGEIELALSQHSAIKDCVVTTQTSKLRERRLAAFVVSAVGQTARSEELKRFLHEKLPEYMVPSFIGVIEQLPLTENGKIDRDALPNIDELSSKENVFVAPQTEVERKLAAAWSKVLGLDRVGVHDNFFDLGGYSLLAVKLVNEIERELGQKVPLMTLFETATIAGLADVLSNDSRPQAWPTLIQIQAGNSQKPLFCVSAPNVNALGYVSLARALGPEQTTFGLQAQYPEDAESEHSQFVVENVAAEYLQALQAEQPHGPYQLIGMCRGAHIAYEIASRLHEQGETVSLLGILDTFVMENTYNYLWYVEHYVKRLRFWLRLPAKRKVRIINSHWRKVVSNRHSPESVLHRVYFPGPDFEPKTYAGRILVLRVMKQPRNRISSKDLGWRRLARGGVDVRMISGTHQTLLREPHVRILASELREFIDYPQSPLSEASENGSKRKTVNFFQPT